jgi:asparagine synthase (glutamine-hydrolysing)
MCGIFGIVSTRPADEVRELARRGLRALAHRGPDDEGLEVFSATNGLTVALGHQRLSILDLSPAGHQPMRDEVTGDWITYNGEVFNFREVRSRMHDRAFSSESDTEVILAGLASRDLEAINPWRGMFALAWWDRSREALVLLRDRLGIKPLYYFHRGDELIFASEVRALLESGLVPRRISRSALKSYLAFGSVEQPLTIVENVYSVLPGHAATFLGGKLTEQAYWTLDAKASDSSNGAINTRELGGLLEEAVRLRLVSDVPVGVFLSGGIDSSSLVSLLSRVSDGPVNTFSVAFNEKDFSEQTYARRVATRFRTEHHEILLTPESVLEKLPLALADMDQPSIDGINSWVVSEAVASAGLKVAISGLGGDEVFAGYNFFRTLVRDEARLKRAQQIPRPIRETAARAVALAASGNRATKFESLLRGDNLDEPVVRLHRLLFTRRQRESLLREDTRSVVDVEDERRLQAWTDDQVERCAFADAVNRTSALELGGYLANTLLRDTDSMSMAHGLEVRVPLIDHLIVERMMKVAGDSKLKAGRPKWLLVDAVGDLPEEIVNRPKKGFELPFKHWLLGSLRDRVVAAFERPQLDSILDPSGLKRVWSEFERGNVSWSRVWSLYVIDQWARCNL